MKINVLILISETNRLLLLLIIGFLFHSCTPKIKSNLAAKTFAPISESAEIFALQLGEKVPENSFYVGDLKIGDSGFSTNCGYTAVLEAAKNRARASGANLIFLTEVKQPNMGSTCYRIKAKMFRNIEEGVVADIAEKRTMMNKSRLPQDADYAVVYFYRPRNYTGSVVGYKIRHNDETVIGKARNGEKFEFKTKSFGRQKFWARTESPESVIIDVQKGQEYFIRCGIKMGVAVGKPEMYVMENYLGIQEYEEMK